MELELLNSEEATGDNAQDGWLDLEDDTLMPCDGAGFLEALSEAESLGVVTLFSESEVEVWW